MSTQDMQAAFLAALSEPTNTPAKPEAAPKRLGYVKIPGVQDLSYSKLNTLHSCPRKFRLAELEGRKQFSPSAHTAFGHAYGAGVQEFIRYYDQLGPERAQQRAVVAALAAWDTFDLDDADAKGIKSFWKATQAVALWCVQEGARLMEDWELAVLDINGRVVDGIELQFYIRIGERFSYQGHIDLVLRNRHTGELCVLEVKTVSRPSAQSDWANSSQTIGYNVLLQAMGALHDEQVSYNVRYLVYNASAQETTEFQFSRSLAERSEWVTSLLTDVRQMELYSELGIWPKRGGSCRAFFRDCEFFGTCDLSYIAHGEPELGTYEATPLEDVDFVIDIEQLLEAQEAEAAQL